MSFRTSAFRSSNGSVDSGAVYTSDIMETGTTSRSSMGIDSSRAALEERLHEIMVFELREDGTSEYCTMSLRGLYNYVVKCIAQSCKDGKVERNLVEAKHRTPVVRFDLNDENIPTSSSSQIVNETPNDTSMQNPPHLPSLTSTSPSDMISQTSNHKNTNSTRHRRQSSSNIPLHHNRLGGYLHPRDMRRLVTPFSASNEPQLMVRRHVMLLNFDPLRAVVLRDRVLVLVPDGADSILITLEKRVRGGIAEIENDVFGSAISGKSSEHLSRNVKQRLASQVVDGSEHNSEEDEWEEIPDIDDTPYELLSVDAVLQTVTSMLVDEARRVTLRAVESVRELRGESGGQKISGMPGEHAQERLRWLKDEINGMVGRIQGFIRALNEMLDEDEDMALMNLSRLITHPERFIQPVSAEVLQEESDEPELILEVYLQQALSIVNELELLKAQIMTTQEQISMTLDAMRNRLLYINTLLSLASLVVAIGSFIGSIFGMNLHNPFEDDTDTNIWFLRVTIGTSVSVITLFFVLAFFFYKQTSSTTDWKKKRM